MGDKNTDPYLTFKPGTNFWTKMPRLLMFSFERLIVLAVIFAITYITLSLAFSFNWPWPKVLFLFVMIAFAIFLILPAPSSPHEIMWSEVFIRPLKGIRTGALPSSTKIEPMERVEDKHGI